MSAIFNNLLVTGNTRTTGSQSIGESGEMREGDHRAITGDGMYNFLNYPYKRILYLENGYNQATVPIIIDDIVKKTGKISIQILFTKTTKNIPSCIQIYDPDNWLDSVNTRNSKVRALDIFVSALGSRGSSSSAYFGDSILLYHGNRDYKISVAVNSGSNNDFSNPNMKFVEKISNNNSYDVIMFLFRIWKSYDQTEHKDVFSLEPGVYKTYSSIAGQKALKYMSGGNEF